MRDISCRNAFTLQSWRRKQENQRRGLSPCLMTFQTPVTISSRQQKPIPYSYLSSSCSKHLVIARGGPLVKLVSLSGLCLCKATLAILMPLGMDSECPMASRSTPCFWVGETQQESSRQRFCFHSLELLNVKLPGYRLGVRLLILQFSSTDFP